MKLVGSLLILFLVIGLFVWLGWFFSEGEIEVPGTVTAKISHSRFVGVKLQSQEIKGYLDDVASESGKMELKINFVGRMANDDTLVQNFWPKSEWGKTGIACGKPKYNNDKTQVTFNFYITPNYLVKSLGKDEATIQANRFFRLCLILATNSQNQINQKISEVYRQYEVIYKSRNLIKL